MINKQPVKVIFHSAALSAGQKSNLKTTLERSFGIDIARYLADLGAVTRSFGS